ncbi:MAG: class I SAM-dependent methyltransferase [Spirochaetaceae bacterium]|nr:class I SAM-dependent methyltransferase [Spirochaetaceae bacterium]
MKNYEHENASRYRRVADRVVDTRAVAKYGTTDCEDFSSRAFLKDVIPRLRFDRERPTALELGTGVGPGALFLADHGFRVHGIDLIPEAIEQARRRAAERGVDVTFEVMDVTRIPHDGPAYDLIVDSFCLQGIALDADREAVFRAVKARLAPRGYYLVSTAIYEPRRHHQYRQAVDRETGRKLDGYDDACLYDPHTDLCYWRYDGEAEIDGAITVDGTRFFPARRYRNGPRLRAEVESYGFEVLLQSGEWGESLVAVHRGSEIGLSSMA